MKKNTNKIITVGIITVPLSPVRKYYQVCGDSYISTAHSEWLKSAGLSILAIPYNTTVPS